MNLNKINMNRVVGTQMRGFSQEGSPPNTGLYFEGMDQDADEGALREIFEKYGDVQSVNILMNGKGFINYTDLDHAVAATEGLNSEFTLDGKNFTFGYVRPRNHKDSKMGRQLRSVYVGNINFGTEAW